MDKACVKKVRVDAYENAKPQIATFTVPIPFEYPYNR